jgi:hypothetical protein
MAEVIWILGISCTVYTVWEIRNLTQMVRKPRPQAWDQQGRPLRIEVLP